MCIRDSRIAQAEFASSLDNIAPAKLADLERGWIYASQDWPTGWTLVADNPELVADLDIAFVWCDPDFDCDTKYAHISHWISRWEMISACGPLFRWYVNPESSRANELAEWLGNNYPEIWREYTPEKSKGLDAHFGGRKAWWNVCKY